jgi:hypothetical protein
MKIFFHSFKQNVVKVVTCSGELHYFLKYGRLKQYKSLNLIVLICFLTY